MPRARHPDGLVASFGLYWDRYKLEAGTRGRHGASRMLGYAYSYRDFEQVMLGGPRPGARGLLRDPFPPIIDHRGQAGVYALYDEQFDLLYVGQSGSEEGGGTIHTRILSHHRNSSMQRTGQFFRQWRWCSWFGLQGPNNLQIVRWYKDWDATARMPTAEREEKRLALSSETFKADLPARRARLKGVQAFAIDQLEALLITLAEPPYNRQGPQWRGAVEYLQVSDDPRIARADPSNQYRYRYWLGPRADDWGQWGRNPNDVLKRDRSVNGSPEEGRFRHDPGKVDSDQGD